MLLAQGWKQAQVHVLMLSRIQQPGQPDMWPPQPPSERWQIYRGTYNPPVQTYKDAAWTFLDSRESVGELLYAVVLPEMLLWEDGDQQAKSLQAVLQHIYAEFQKIAQYVEQAVSAAPVDRSVSPLTMGHGVYVPEVADGHVFANADEAFDYVSSRSRANNYPPSWHPDNDEPPF